MHGDISELPRVAFWLVPRRQERAILQSIIVALANRYSVPAFVPHVTVYTCKRTQEQRELAVMAGLARRCRPFAMQRLGLSGKDRLTQALFASLQQDAAIVELSQLMRAGVPLPSNYHIEPHLSLLYQNISEAERETLVQEIQIPLRKISFDELWAVAIPDQLNTLDDLDDWQNLLICRLDSRLFPDTIGNLK